MAVDIAGQIKRRAAAKLSGDSQTAGSTTPPHAQGPPTTEPTEPGIPTTDPTDPGWKPPPGQPWETPPTEKTPPPGTTPPDWEKMFREMTESSNSSSYTPGSFEWNKPLTPGQFNFTNLNLPSWETPEEYKPIDPFKAPEAFKAPTEEALVNDPAYQARIAAGEKAIERSAAARGTLLTGGTLTDLEKYAQGEASNELEKLYNRSWNEHEAAYAKSWNEWNTSYTHNMQENEMAWNRSLTKYQTEVEAAFKSWNANFQNYSSWYNAESQNLLTEYNAARNKWSEEEQGRANSANQAAQQEAARMRFLEQMAGM